MKSIIRCVFLAYLVALSTCGGIFWKGSISAFNVSRRLSGVIVEGEDSL